MRSQFVVRRVKNVVENEFFETIGVEIRFDNRTFVHHLTVFDRLILPLHHFANVKPTSTNTVKRSSADEHLRLQNVDDSKEQQDAFTLLIDGGNAAKRISAHMRSVVEDKMKNALPEFFGVFRVVGGDLFIT